MAVVLNVLGTNKNSVFLELSNLDINYNKSRKRRVDWYFKPAGSDLFTIEKKGKEIENEVLLHREKVPIDNGTYDGIRAYLYYYEDDVSELPSYKIIEYNKSAFVINNLFLNITNYDNSKQICSLIIGGLDPEYSNKEREVSFKIEQTELNSKITLENRKSDYNIEIKTRDFYSKGQYLLVAKIDWFQDSLGTFGGSFYLAEEFEIQNSGQGGTYPIISMHSIIFNRIEEEIEYNFSIKNINTQNYSVDLFFNGEQIRSESVAFGDYDEPPYDGVLNYEGSYPCEINSGTYNWKIEAKSYQTSFHVTNYPSELTGEIEIISKGSTGIKWTPNEIILLEDNKSVICSYYPKVSAINFKNFCDDVQKKFDINIDDMTDFKSLIEPGMQMERSFFEFLLDCMGAEDEKEQLKNQLVMYNTNNNFDCFLLLENAYKKYS